MSESEKVARTELYNAVSNNSIDKAHLLISQKCVSQKDISIALSLAASLGNLQISQILIASGADINNDYRGFTTLTGAIYEGHIEIVRILLEAGADISYPEYGEVSPPLSVAAARGNLEMVKLLVEAGANVNQVAQSSGDYALASAAGGGYTEVFNYLAPLTNLELREEAEKVLPLGIHERELEENVDPLVKELSGFVFNEDLNGVKETLEKGVDVNGFDEIGNTALNIAVARNNLEIVSMLLKAGANPNLANDCGYLPLDFSSGNITALLIDAANTVPPSSTR